VNVGGNFAYRCNLRIAILHLIGSLGERSTERLSVPPRPGVHLAYVSCPNFEPEEIAK
jgi:hypothetical protein